MTPKIVSTKEELKSAKEQGITEIIVSGKLANDLKKSKKIALAGTVTIGILTAALAATPFTGGITAFAAAPVAALTGVEIVAIIAAASIGLALIIAVYKEYDEVSYENGKLVLRKKQKN